MRHRWCEDEIEFKPLVLDVEDRTCRICSAFMHVCDHRKRHVYTLDGGLLLVNRLQHCVDKKQRSDKKPKTVPQADFNGTGILRSRWRGGVRSPDNAVGIPDLLT